MSATKEQVKLLCRELKLPQVARQFEVEAEQALKSGATFEESLLRVLEAESLARHESAVRERMRSAKFPEVKTLSSLKLDVTDGLDPSLLKTLTTCDWVEQKQNVLLVGPIGTGKTHVAIGLGVEAAKRKKRVLFVRCADLVRELLEARDERTLGRLHRRLSKVDVLVLDEFGFVPFERAGGELLFNVVADRYEQGSVVVTTNLAFSEWPKVMGGDEKLTTAMLDRLAHHAVVVTTKGKSYRMKSRQPVGQEVKQAKKADQSA
jgi:DNA replication protein DnaC